MRSKREEKRIRNIGLLLPLLGIVFFVSIGVGSVDITKSLLLMLLGDSTFPAIHASILWNIRIPRSIVVLFVGANLAVSGAILQAVMKNHLADPQIVGVSSGAGLAGVAMLILCPHLVALVPTVAFVGAMVAAMAVYALAWNRGIMPQRIILSGVAVSAFLSSGISGFLVFYGERVQGALLWLVGGFSAVSWPQVHILLPYTLVAFVAAMLGSRELTILCLGDDRAKSLGMRVEMVRFVMTGVAAFLAAISVSVSGLIGFVGLIVPHMARKCVGEAYPFLIPASAIMGGILLLISDTLGRTIYSPIEIPVGVITAFLGAPFFLYILRRYRI